VAGEEKKRGGPSPPLDFPSFFLYPMMSMYQATIFTLAFMVTVIE